MRGFAIGKLSSDTGVKVPTIRYYESVGLLPLPHRSESNRRTYGPETARRLRFIRHARELGFEIAAIRQLLALTDNPEALCSEADCIAREHLTEIDSKLSRLTALREELQRMVRQCAHERIKSCRVIEVLADHAHCVHDQH
jgi:DNA-binding transcriptional MerR regulator